LGAKTVLVYGVTKVLVTKAGIVVMKKQTITVASGVTKVAVLAVSATALSAAFAKAGVPLELNDDSIEELSNKAIDLFSKGE
ncbi:hypothetical protein, partial [Umezakia ovalisporum]|uniref:hypothetical protein n=1 Tax=Umezakia ovalisporum TaxID=75695 RepID=UPI0039C7131F